MNMTTIELKIEKIKISLWKVGLIKNCPKCNGNLQQVGHIKEVGWIDYMCTSDECDFGKQTPYLDNDRL
jgi:hypothetical protein